MQLNISNILIKSQNEVELLGITIDNKLNFSSHIKKTCSTANKKLSAIVRLRIHLNIDQTKLLVNAHVLTHFLYCPLIWMFSNKSDQDKIVSVHKRSLRTISNEFTLSYTDLLTENNTTTIHQRHLPMLMTETFKIKNKIGLELLREFFIDKVQPYNLRNKVILALPPTRSKTFGTNSINFKSSIIWNTLPNEIKLSPNIRIFKNNIKNWYCENCTCKCCI